MPGGEYAGGNLDVALATSHHLLAVAEDVSADEVEALAVSRSPRARWLAQKHLQLCAGASVTGPWRLDDAVRRAFDLPSWAMHAYLLRCPVQRSGPVPEELRGTDELLDAFPSGVPEGVEAEALSHLRAIARRLRGALRVAGTGAVLLPDPDAAVDLTVLSPVWLDLEACQRVLGQVLPGVRSLLEVTGPPTSSSGTENRAVEGGEDATADATEGRAGGAVEDRSRNHLALDDGGPRAAAAARLGPDERAWLHAEADAFDAAALTAEQILSGYGLAADLGDGELIEISVTGSEHVPTVLRDVPWAKNGLITYEIRWQPADPETAYARRPPLAVRRKRAAVAELVERAAIAVQGVVGGEISDDDGFLVAPETTG